MLRRIDLWVLVALLAAFLPFYWLLRDNRPGGVAAKPIEIAELRRLASSIPGPAPDNVEMTMIARRLLPADLLAAGAGLRLEIVGVLAYRLAVPGRGPIVIDSGLRESAARTLGMSRYEREEQKRLSTTLQAASLILLTDDNPDHTDGVLALHDRGANLDTLRLNPAQRAALFKRDGPAATIAGSGAQAVAPGIVVVPAPSHSPGSQLIYARLANGREYLFAGDVAPLDESWRQLRARSRLLSQLRGNENRSEAYAWLKTIRHLKRQAPAMLIVPGHDFRQLYNYPLKPRIPLGFSADRLTKSD